MSNTVRLDPYTTDELQDMNDDRIEALYSMVRDAINRQYKAKDFSPQGEKELLRLQTELCYVHREVEIRRNRKRLHEEYMKSRSQYRRTNNRGGGQRGNSRSYRQKRH